MALTHGTDQMVDIQDKHPSINIRLDKTRCAVQKVGQLRSVKLKNLSLRIINGDVYSRERMHRFGMIDSPLCQSCGEVDTIRHHLLECNTAKKIWMAFGRIYKEVTKSTFEITLENVINCNINYNSKAITTIIAELNRINLRNKGRELGSEKVQKYIIDLIKCEQKCVDMNKTRLESSWNKWVTWSKSCHSTVMGSDS
jgi:hypothetical protein